MHSKSMSEWPARPRAKKKTAARKRSTLITFRTLFSCKKSTGESLERRARWLATGCRNGLEGALAESPGGELESRL